MLNTIPLDTLVLISKNLGEKDLLALSATTKGCYRLRKVSQIWQLYACSEYEVSSETFKSFLHQCDHPVKAYHDSITCKQEGCDRRIVRGVVWCSRHAQVNEISICTICGNGVSSGVQNFELIDRPCSRCMKDWFGSRCMHCGHACESGTANCRMHSHRNTEYNVKVYARADGTYLMIDEKFILRQHPSGNVQAIARLDNGIERHLTEPEKVFVKSIGMLSEMP